VVRGRNSERLVIIKTLLVISDSHCNSTVGLSKPTVGLDDGDKVSANVARRWLFWTFNDILDKVKQKQRGDLYTLLNGDVIETDAKDRSLQLISKNQEEAISYGVEVFEPLMQISKGVYVVRGTEAHAGKQAQAEEAFAKNFDNVIRDSETGNASRWYLPLEIDGVRMDIAHHPRGAGSGRPMNKMGGIMRIASDALFDYANDGEVPPHLVIRSHLHGYKDSYDAFRTRAIITPAMSLLTAYTYRIGINMSNPVGAILIFCHEGKYHVEPLLYPVRKATWEIL
jgi:hypothetical protein